MTHILIIDAPYYSHISDKLIEGATDVLKHEGATYEQIDVPGVLEIPAALSMVLEAEMEGGTRYDGFVVLGCVIRGETTHYDTVCNDSSRAITMLGLQGLFIGNGILTVENMAQAEARAEVAGQNKGGGAAAAALHLIALSRKWGSSGKSIGFTSEILARGGTSV